MIIQKKYFKILCLSLFVISATACESQEQKTERLTEQGDATNASIAVDVATEAAANAVAAAEAAAEKSSDMPQSSNNENSLSDNEKLIICKKAIADLMGKPTSIMKASVTPEKYVRVVYTRADDGKTFKNECKFEGNSVIWRGVDIFAPGEGPGRWRDMSSDEKITWNKNGKSLEVTVGY